MKTMFSKRRHLCRLQPSKGLVGVLLKSQAAIKFRKMVLSKIWKIPWFVYRFFDQILFFVYQFLFWVAYLNEEMGVAEALRFLLRV